MKIKIFFYYFFIFFLFFSSNLYSKPIKPVKIISLNEEINQFTFTNNNNLIVTTRNNLSIWDIKKFKQIKKINLPDISYFKYFPDINKLIVFYDDISPTKKFIAISLDNLKYITNKTNSFFDNIVDILANSSLHGVHKCPLFTISLNNEYLAIEDNKFYIPKIIIWDIKKKSIVSIIEESYDYGLGIKQLAFSLDNNYIISVKDNETINIWDFKNKKLVKQLCEECFPSINFNYNYYILPRRGYIDILSQDFNTIKTIKSSSFATFSNNYIINTLEEQNFNIIRIQFYNLKNFNIEDEIILKKYNNYPITGLSLSIDNQYLGISYSNKINLLKLHN